MDFSQKYQIVILNRDLETFCLILKAHFGLYLDCTTTTTDHWMWCDCNVCPPWLAHTFHTCILLHLPQKATSHLKREVWSNTVQDLFSYLSLTPWVLCWASVSTSPSFFVDHLQRVWICVWWFNFQLQLLKDINNILYTSNCTSWLYHLWPIETHEN